jgi:hypothetical protein
LEVENIDKLVIILNNWPFDVCMEFDEKGGFFYDFLNEEATLIENYVALIMLHDASITSIFC